MLGGFIPPPVFEVTCTDRAFMPATVKVVAGQSVKFKAVGSLNHIIVLGSGEEVTSPLMKPGTSWIMKPEHLSTGTHKVHCEVTCMRCVVVVDPPATPRGRTQETELPVDLADEEEEEEEEINDPRIDAMLAQLRAGNEKAVKVAQRLDEEDDFEEQEDEADFLRQRHRMGVGGPLVIDM